MAHVRLDVRAIVDRNVVGTGEPDTLRSTDLAVDGGMAK
jgi:hypothetical protein